MRNLKFDLSHRNLYLCTPLRDDLSKFVRESLRGGVDVIQIRDKTADAKTIIRYSKEIRKIASDFEVPFIINDRPDIALEVEADGVHIGQDDIPVSLVRKVFPDAIVGLSTHSEKELNTSLIEDVEYISAGPIVETPTKPGRAGTGSSYAELACKVSKKPVFVTGGIDPSKISSLVALGVRHFVVVRFLTRAEDPYRNAVELRSAIQRALEN